LARWIERHSGWKAGKLLFVWLRARFAPRLRILVSGGAALDPDLHRTLAALGWEVLTGYGLTETGPILAFNRLRETRIGTVGRALDGVALRIANPDADGVGEIEAQGPNVFFGYRGNPSATEAAFTSDGWFRTGDLGAIDSNGYLRIVARKSEVIVLPDGKKVDPELLEAAYQEHPAVRELGIFMQDGGLCAVLVPELSQLGAHGHAQVREEVQRIVAGIAALRPSYQRLAGLAISRTPLPRTPVGKIRRHLLPNLYRALREGRAAPPKHPCRRKTRLSSAIPQLASYGRGCRRGIRAGP
jgi:long-chain acyl-CoA synthetase